MPRGVIFDIDGTLIDLVDAHATAWQRAFAEFGHDVNFDRVRSQIGKGGDQLLPVFLSRAEIERIGGQLEAFRSRLFKQEYLPGLRAFLGVRAAVRAVRVGGTAHRAGVVGEGRRVGDLQAQGGHRGSGRRARRRPTTRRNPSRIPTSSTPRSIGWGCRRADAVVVGDSPYDAEAAGKLGLRTIGVRCGGFPEADLRAAGCVAIYDGPEDLRVRFETSPLAGR